MPEIKFPEVRFPEIKLPEGLRDMSREDIQKAVSDVKMSDIQKAVSDVKLPKRSDIQKDIQKSQRDIQKSLEKALPARPAPSVVPFAVLAMLGGLIVGWILATSPLTGPRISAAMGGVRQKIDEWRSNTDVDELDGEPEAFRDAFRSPTKAGGSLASDAVGVGPGRYSETGATNGGASVGAESVSSERF
jgi:hypothetical protein